MKRTVLKEAALEVFKLFGVSSEDKLRIKCCLSHVIVNADKAQCQKKHN